MAIARGEEKRKIRLRNLRMLHQKHSWLEIAEKSNVSAAYLSQIANEVRRDGKTGSPRGLTDLYADRIEKGLHLPTGWFDIDHGAGLNETSQPPEPPPTKPPASVSFLSTPFAGSAPAPQQATISLGGNDYFLIPHFRHTGNHSAPLALYRPAAPIAIPVDWFERNAVEPANCRALLVEDDAMEPTIESGFVVLIDVSRKAVRDNALYALTIDGDLFFRRVFRVPGSALDLRPDNTSHPQFSCPTDKVSILGEIVWRAG